MSVHFLRENVREKLRVLLPSKSAHYSRKKDSFTLNSSYIKSQITVFYVFKGSRNQNLNLAFQVLVDFLREQNVAKDGKTLVFTLSLLSKTNISEWIFF